MSATAEAVEANAKTGFAKQQNYYWNLLPNSPIASSRTDDIWFFNEKVGWLVNSSGYICKTESGGDCWEPKFYLCPSSPGKPYLRCMGWGSEQVGWIGSVTMLSDKDLFNPNNYLKTLLHHTTDGGETWKAVENLPIGSPSGICGFHAVNEKVAYGSGTNDPGLPGPGIVKTTDGGKTWDLIDMQAHADNLIDIYFFDEDNGIVVGGKLNPKVCPATAPGYPPPRLSRYTQLRPVILKTSDGGKSWTNTAADTAGLSCGEWGWKIQFLDEKVGFISLENFVSAAILKTTDGGNSWARMPIKQYGTGLIINMDLEGIGFINENEGWVGGWGSDFRGWMNSFTPDGGKNWVREDYFKLPGGSLGGDQRTRINRYRFIGNPVTAGYCSGQQVFKLQIGGLPKRSAFAEVGTYMEPARAGETGNQPPLIEKGDFAKESSFASNSSGTTKSDLAKRSAFSQASQASLPLIDHDFNISYKALDDGAVEISYQLPDGVESVFLGLWNQLAFCVRTLVNETRLSRGKKKVIWDGRDDVGDPVGEGVYICRVSVNGLHGGSEMVQLAAPA